MSAITPARRVRLVIHRLQNASVVLGVVAAMSLTGYAQSPVFTLVFALVAGLGSYGFWFAADRVAARQVQS